jgi:hypothetical protein
MFWNLGGANSETLPKVSMSLARDVTGWVVTSDIDHLQLAPCDNVSSGLPATPKNILHLHRCHLGHGRGGYQSHDPCPDIDIRQALSSGQSCTVIVGLFKVVRLDRRSSSPWPQH